MIGFSQPVCKRSLARTRRPGARRCNILTGLTGTGPWLAQMLDLGMLSKPGNTAHEVIGQSHAPMAKEGRNVLQASLRRTQEPDRTFDAHDKWGLAAACHEKLAVEIQFAVKVHLDTFGAEAFVAVPGCRVSIESPPQHRKDRAAESLGTTPDGGEADAPALLRPKRAHSQEQPIKRARHQDDHGCLCAANGWGLRTVQCKADRGGLVEAPILPDKPPERADKSDSKAPLSAQAP